MSIVRIADKTFWWVISESATGLQPQQPLVQPLQETRGLRHDHHPTVPGRGPLWRCPRAIWQRVSRRNASSRGRRTPQALRTRISSTGRHSRYEKIVLWLQWRGPACRICDFTCLFWRKRAQPWTPREPCCGCSGVPRFWRKRAQPWTPREPCYGCSGVPRFYPESAQPTKSKRCTIRRSQLRHQFRHRVRDLHQVLNGIGNEGCNRQ